MKFTSAQQALVECVTIAYRAVPSRPQPPQLAAIFVEARNGQVWFGATDGEITIKTRANALVHDPGNVLLPARYLAEIIRAMPRGELNWEQDIQANSVSISQGRSVFTLSMVSTEGIPELIVPPSGGLTLRGFELGRLFRKVSFAASREEARYVLTGVCLSLQEGRLRAVATDGYRLAIANLVPDEDIGKASLSLIMPSRTVNELIRLLKAPDDILRMVIDRTYVHFILQSTSLSSRLIDGEYPDYSRVIPASYVGKFRLDTRELLQAVERAALLSSGELAPVRIEASSDKLIVSSDLPEVGSVIEELDVVGEGESFQLVFNAGFFAEGLKVVETDEVVLELSEGAKSLSIREYDSRDFLYIVLPMRVKGE